MSNATLAKKINNVEKRLAALEVNFGFHRETSLPRRGRQYASETMVRRLLEEVEVARIIAEGELDYRHGRVREVKSSKNLFKR